MTRYIRGNDKIATLAVLLGAPLTDQHFERLGIPYLSTVSDVVVLDCMRLVGRFPDEIKANRVEWPLYAAPRTSDELRDILAHYAPQFAFDDIGMAPETAFVGEIVRQSGTRLVCVHQGRLPRPSLFDRLQLVAMGRPSRPATPNVDNAQEVDHGPAGLTMVPRIVSRIVKEFDRRFHVPSPDLALLAGTRALDWYARRAADRLWIGSDDYYVFQRATPLGSPSLTPFAVFVDVCLPLAADWKLLGIAPPISAEEYYPMLRALFDRVEQISNMSVVVAGHPNSRAVSNYTDLLGGRQLVFGKTAHLVKHSALVLSHASTATSFVAMAKRPVMFVSSRKIDRSAYGAHVRAMARSLNAPLLMLEQINALTTEILTRPADAAASKRYVERYLRAPWTSETSPWTTFNEFLARSQRPSAVS